MNDKINARKVFDLSIQAFLSSDPAAMDKAMECIETVFRVASAPKPEAQAAWKVLQIGNYGAAYDLPNARRAFTYEHQPGNVLASRLGSAATAAVAASAGDSIDRGLSLLKSLQDEGFGVFQVDVAALSTPASHDAQQPVREEMSPDFTDSARAAIAWVLYHHQGGSSPVGQPLRFALGMGANEPLPDWRIAEAKAWAEWAKATTADFHAQQPAVVGDGLALLRKRLEELSRQYGPLSPVGAGIDRAIRELDALTPAATPGDGSEQ